MPSRLTLGKVPMEGEKPEDLFTLDQPWDSTTDTQFSGTLLQPLI